MAASDFPDFVRLHVRADFDRVFKHGQRSTDTVFRIYMYPAAGRTARRTARLGLSVPRSVAAHATERNRIKRQIRESFRRHREVLPLVDIVVQALTASASTDNPGLRRSLEWHWRQVIERCAAS